MVKLYLLLLFLVWVPAQAASCGPAFSALAPSASLKPVAPLPQLVREAGLEDKVALLRTHSRGVIGINEFLPMRAELGSGYLLAADRINFTSEFFSRMQGLKHWSDGYREVRVFYRANNHTDEYLSKITQTGKPIVFLVPPNLMDHPGITRNEMLWLLEDPANRMKNVTFVFGAYDIFPEEVIERFGRQRNWDEIRKLLSD
jgi:hypothetical protein